MTSLYIKSLDRMLDAEIFDSSPLQFYEHPIYKLNYLVLCYIRTGGVYDKS